jgi:hypothetical protein
MAGETTSVENLFQTIQMAGLRATNKSHTNFLDLPVRESNVAKIDQRIGCSIDS